MKHARIRYQGKKFDVTVDEQLRVCLPDGTTLTAEQVEWLPLPKAPCLRSA